MIYMIILIILVIIIIALMVYNVIVYKKIQNYNDINQKITSLNVLQDFMNTIGDYTSVDEKIQRIKLLLFLMEQNMLLKRQTLKNSIGKL